MFASHAETAACARAWKKLGTKIAAMIEMMATTTMSSNSVKPRSRVREEEFAFISIFLIRQVMLQRVQRAAM